MFDPPFPACKWACGNPRSLEQTISVMIGWFEVITVNQILFGELWRASNERSHSDRASETSHERRMRFLRSAAEAEELAKQAPRPVQRLLCLDIAQFWRAMAMQEEAPPEDHSNLIHWPEARNK